MQWRPKEKKVSILIPTPYWDMHDYNNYYLYLNTPTSISILETCTYCCCTFFDFLLSRFLASILLSICPEVIKTIITVRLSRQWKCSPQDVTDLLYPLMYIFTECVWSYVFRCYINTFIWPNNYRTVTDCKNTRFRFHLGAKTLKCCRDGLVGQC